MQPLRAGGNNFRAVIKAEAMLVRVAEVVEGLNAAASARIQCFNQIRSGIDPDNGGSAFASLLIDHADIILFILTATHVVARAIDNPDDGRIFAVSLADFVHAHGAAADEIRPPTVVLVFGHPVALPALQGRTAGDDDMICPAEWGKNTANQRE